MATPFPPGASDIIEMQAIILQMGRWKLMVNGIKDLRTL
jgi:hypothetical protein